METLGLGILISSPSLQYGLHCMISMYAKENNYIEDTYMQMTCVGNTFVQKKEYDVCGT